MIFLAYLCSTIINIAVFVDSATYVFETKTAANEFIDLENLIGSMHTYFPEKARLIVRDLGLTDGQRLLLQRYQNVQIKSSKYRTCANWRLVDVKSEIVTLDWILFDRRNNNSLLHVDSIRKRFRLAVVVPFIKSQLTSLVAQLNASIMYSPCRNRSDSIDIIFYHNEAPFSEIERIFVKLIMSIHVITMYDS